MVRRRSFTSMAGLAVTGSRSMLSRTLASPSAPLPLSRAVRTSSKVSIPTMRPLSITTSEPMLCCAMIETASVSLPSGAMVKSALPLTLRISLTCMGPPLAAHFPHDNTPGDPRAPTGTNRRTMPFPGRGQRLNLVRLFSAGATEVRGRPVRFDWSKMGRVPPAALLSRVLPAKGGGVRVGIRISRLELIVTSGDSVLDAFQFDGRTDAAAGVWIDSKLHALGLKPAGVVRLPYSLPDHPTGGRSHELGMLGRELGELSRWFGGPAEVLEEFAGKLAGLRPGPGPLLCWPHHFDLAMLVRLDVGAGESARSVGAGVSQGDGFYAQPYVYVSPWPRLEGSLPDLPPPGHWHTEGFFGAVATGEEILAMKDRGKGLLAFITAAFEIGRARLGA